MLFVGLRMRTSEIIPGGRLRRRGFAFSLCTLISMGTNANISRSTQNGEMTEQNRFIETMSFGDFFTTFMAVDAFN